MSPSQLCCSLLLKSVLFKVEGSSRRNRGGTKGTLKDLAFFFFFFDLPRRRPRERRSFSFSLA